MHEGFDSYQCLKVEIQPTNMGSTLRYRFETWDFTISNTKNLRTWVQYHGIYMKFDLTWGMGMYGMHQKGHKLYKFKKIIAEHRVSARGLLFEVADSVG